MTAATSRAPLERIRAFTRGRAIAEHLAAFPLDRPSLAAVVQRRLRGPTILRADTVMLVDVAERLEARHPDRAVSGEVDSSVDRVIEALLAANGSCLVPTAVRCEARGDAQTHGAANANRWSGGRRPRSFRRGP